MAVACGLLAAACSGSSSSTTPVTPTPTPGDTSSTVVTIPAGATTLTTTAYNPNPAAVAVGTTVKWVNNDTVSHTSTSTTNVWASPTILPGNSYSFTFQSRGSFPYYCVIHPGMVGTITVQ
jgi:plastocyanin